MQKQARLRGVVGDASADGDTDDNIAGDSEAEGAETRSTADKARDAFLKEKSALEAIILQSAKSFAMAGVPVLTIRSELCEGTLLAAVRHFLDRFLNYRRSLLLGPQCIPLPKARHGSLPLPHRAPLSWMSAPPLLWLLGDSSFD